MASRGGQVGGNGGPIKRALWLFFVACVVAAVWNSMPHDPDGFWAKLQDGCRVAADVGIRFGNWILNAVTEGFGGDAPSTNTK